MREGVTIPPNKRGNLSFFRSSLGITFILTLNTFTDSTTGTLFTSGSLGMFYSESLVNHVSQDFYKVNSMKGVYLTTQKMSDGSLKTLISLDRGAEWKPIKVKNCHKVFSPYSPSLSFQIQLLYLTTKLYWFQTFGLSEASDRDEYIANHDMPSIVL